MLLDQQPPPSMSVSIAQRASDEARLTAIDVQIAILFAERDNILARLSTFTCPVNSVPTELTIQIFRYYLPDYPICPPILGVGSPTTLTQVCRRWRTIALATPSLWRSLALFEHVPGHHQLATCDAQLAAAKTWIKRSHSLPLSIFFGAQRPEEGVRRARDEAFQLILSQQSRWEYMRVHVYPHPAGRHQSNCGCADCGVRAFYLYRGIPEPENLKQLQGSAPEPESLEQLQGSAPLLRDFHITYLGDSRAAEWYEGDSEGEYPVVPELAAPRLRTLCCEMRFEGLYLAPVFNMADCTSLTRLFLRFVVPTAVGAVLSQTGALEHCFIQLSRDESWNPDLGDRFAQRPDISLPHLETLILSTGTDYNRWNDDVMSTIYGTRALLDKLHIPTLRRLAIMESIFSGHDEDDDRDADASDPPTPALARIIKSFGATSLELICILQARQASMDDYREDFASAHCNIDTPSVEFVPEPLTEAEWGIWDFYKGRTEDSYGELLQFAEFE
ncbi:F-box domain-containing protein [Mycena kentingensis (nom. inval.)]|nr:F-box domain-containing protein [Mycena kentingensis (nom. inval.)]